MKKSIWSLKLSTAAIVLIPIAIGINYIGKSIASWLKLPLWLDSIGTILSSMLAGPVVGGGSGFISNIIFGITQDPVSTVFAITNGVIGIVVGVLAYKGWVNNLKNAIFLGLIVGVVASIVSTPLNIIYWEGQTGNVWGDTLYAYVLSQNGPMWLASFLNSIVVDVPDKLISVLLSFFIFKGLPKNVLNLYRHNEGFDELK